MKRREIAAKILAFSGLAVWLSYIALFEHYSYTRPTTQSFSAGRIILQNSHGRLTYLTAEEQNRLNALEITPFILFIAAAVIKVGPGIWNWRTPLVERKKL